MLRSVSVATVLLSACAGIASAQAIIPAAARVGDIPGFAGNGLKGEIWTSSVSSIAGTRNIMGANPANATFQATNINYLNDLIGTPLSTWLGADAASLSGISGDTAISALSIRLTGYIAIANAGTLRFNVESDDGMELKIGGESVTSYDGDRGFGGSPASAEFSEAGLYQIELIYWANGAGSSGLKFSWNAADPGNLDVVPEASLYSVIPAPSAIGVLGMAGLVAARRRRC